MFPSYQGPMSRLNIGIVGRFHNTREIPFQLRLSHAIVTCLGVPSQTSKFIHWPGQVRRSALY